MQMIKNVKCQFDTPYNSVTSQCSWFTIAVVENLDKILHAVKTNNFDAYKQYINDCLNIATKNRKNNWKYDLGENIDQVNVNKNFNFFVCKSSIDIENFSQFIPEVKVLQRNYPVILKNDFKNMILNLLPNDKYFIVNKHGESFVVALINNNQYIIIDSHKSSHIICDIDKLMEYIIDDYQGFYYILIGFVNNNSKKYNSNDSTYINVLITNLDTGITKSYTIQKKFMESNINLFLDNNNIQFDQFYILNGTSCQVIDYSEIFTNNLTSIKVLYR